MKLKLKIALLLFSLGAILSTAHAQDTVIVYGVTNASGKIAKIIPGINKDSLSGGGGVVYVDTSNTNWFGINTNTSWVGGADGENTTIGDSAGKHIEDGETNTAIGTCALHDGTDIYYSTALGGYSLFHYDGHSTANPNTGIGAYSMFTTGIELGSTAAGFKSLYAQDSGSDNIAIGQFAGTAAGFAPTKYNSCIFLGVQSGNYVPVDQTNSLIAGSYSDPIYDVWFGDGYRTNSGDADSYTIHGSAGNGTNKNGGSITLAGGISTGSGNGGDIIFKSSPAGSTGTSDNALAELFRFTSLGELKVAGSAGTSGQVLTSGGAGAAPSWADAGGVDTSANYTWTGIHTFERSGGSSDPAFVHILSDSGQNPHGILLENNVNASNPLFSSNPPTIEWLSSLDNVLSGVVPVKYYMRIGNYNGISYQSFFQISSLINDAFSSTLTLTTLADSSASLLLATTVGKDATNFTVLGAANKSAKLQSNSLTFVTSLAGGVYITLQDTMTQFPTLTLPTTDGVITHWVAKPDSATATGVAGDAAFESGWLYICIGANTWQKVAIASWYAIRYLSHLEFMSGRKGEEIY